MYMYIHVPLQHMCLPMPSFHANTPSTRLLWLIVALKDYFSSREGNHNGTTCTYMYNIRHKGFVQSTNTDNSIHLLTTHSWTHDSQQGHLSQGGKLHQWTHHAIMCVKKWSQVGWPGLSLHQKESHSRATVHRLVVSLIYLRAGWEQVKEYSSLGLTYICTCTNVYIFCKCTFKRHCYTLYHVDMHTFIQSVGYDLEGHQNSAFCLLCTHTYKYTDQGTDQCCQLLQTSLLVYYRFSSPLKVTCYLQPPTED